MQVRSSAVPFRPSAVVALVFAAAVSVMVAGCQSQQTGTSTASEGRTLTIGYQADPPTLDPHATENAATGYPTYAVTESLVYLDNQHQLKPWLAETWDFGDGGASFTFHLRHDVIFQDGTPFNAAAVKWNFDRIVDPAFKAGQARTLLAGYTGTDILDEFTARVRFAHPYAQFLEFASTNQLCMLSPTGTAAEGDQVSRKPIGSGPFQVDEWVAQDHVTLSRWTGYTRTSPWSNSPTRGNVSRIVWKIIPDSGTRDTTLESNETQMIFVSNPPDAEHLRSEGFKIDDVVWGSAGANLLLNMTRPPTDDISVRNAITYAVNPDAMVGTAFLGRKAIGPLTAAVLDDPSLRENAAKYDPGRAAQILSDAGWVAGTDGVRVKDGKRLEFVLNVNSTNPPAVAAATYLEAQLRQVGFDVVTKTLALGAFTEDNNHCLANGMVQNILTGGPDALYQLFHSSLVGSNYNWSCLKDPEVDSALERGRQELDPAKRRALYLQLEQKLLAMAVEVPLVDTDLVFALRPDLTLPQHNGIGYPMLASISIVEN